MPRVGSGFAEHIGLRTAFAGEFLDLLLSAVDAQP
jgi:hypothetical protein